MSYQRGINEEFVRLAKFGANLADAHSCFIFMPVSNAQGLGLQTAASASGNNLKNLLQLVAVHSLSPDIAERCLLPSDGGIIGWVAKHQRGIHVSPFERDSRTLGTYTSDQELKSFIGIPITLPDATDHSGVLACDSKKSFAFSKLQGKLLEELALQISAIAKLSNRALQSSNEKDWVQFSNDANHLIDTLGLNSVGAIRIRISNWGTIERSLGAQQSLAYWEQMLRLIKQALPPRTPLLQIPNGELVILVDNMMSSFYESRIEAVSAHLSKHPASFEFSRTSRAKRRVAAASLAELLEGTLSNTEQSGAPVAALKVGGL